MDDLAKSAEEINSKLEEIKVCDTPSFPFFFAFLHCVLDES